MKRFSILMIGLFAILFIFGCSGGGKSYLASPEDTIKTYNEKASMLENMTDPLAYSRAIECFSSPAQQWWSANADSLIKDKSELDGYSGSKREAYVFTRYVVTKGPKTSFGPPKIEKTGESTYNVNGMEVTMVKEGKNWKFNSLWGLDGR